MINPARQNAEDMDVLAPEVRQRRASDPSLSAWVNASAGSGKTTVLTNRVTRLLLDGVSPQRILCLTYTRAAAAEMSNRITDKLSFWATCTDAELGEDIHKLQNTQVDPKQMIEARRLFARVLACPGGMRIRTIHAFCQEILRRFPLEAGLPPHFAVIEENDAQALQDDVRDDLLRRAVAEPHRDLGYALRFLVSELSDNGLSDAVRSLLSDRARLQANIKKTGGLEKLILHLRASLGLRAEDKKSELCRHASSDAVVARDELIRACAALSKGGVTAQRRGTAITNWLALPLEKRIENFDAYIDVFFTSEGEFYKKYADKPSLQICAEAEDIFLREATRLSEVKERLETLYIAEITEALLTFGYAFIQNYEKRKKDQAVLDYDDLIIRTDQLLRRPGIAPWVLYKLDGGLSHILVDEAQDTSRAQWSIVDALSEEFFAGSGIHSDENRTLFVVGDEKQSIFSFQRADPEAFAEMRSYFAKRIEDADKIYDEVPMRVSFRSAPAILKAVDAVFSGQHEGVSSEPMQHFAASPRPHQPEKMGRVEVWPLLQTPPKDKASEDWVLPLGYEPEHDPQAELAKQIATTIKNWLTVKEVLPGYDRPIGAGDIMILLRRRGRFADLMVRALKNQHIDVTGVDRMYLVKQLPVMDLLAMMQFVLLPEDDLNLATVLRGPLLNISEDQLMDLAIKREGSLWASLSENSAFIKEYSYLLGWLDRVDFVSPFTFLSSLLSEACPASLVSGRHALWSRLGPDALDPIDELLNAVQDFSRRHSPSMQHFLQWLMATETEIKRELDRSGGQVRIMTVHASKGLEAPIVFLPDTSKVPRTQDVPKLLWDKNEIPFYLARQPKRGVIKPLWERARLKQMQEYRRLLYVALTRAANRLYVCGWETGNQSMSESWYYQVHDGLKALHQPGFIDPQTPAEIVIADPEIKTQLRKEKAPLKAEPPSLPAWAKENAVEELPAPRTLAPSRHIQEMATATPDSRFVRGRIIHRLLQSLPDVVDAKRDEAASRFLLNPQHGLTPEQQKEIKDEVLRNLIRNPLYAPLFGAASRAEVPLVGLVHGRVVSGQVDRLCLKGDEIWIVDYKTNRPPPEKIEAVPEPYRLQMADYKGVLEAIYPGRTVRCFLLWTYAPKLMELL